MRKHLQVLEHVQDPDDVRVLFLGVLLLLVRPVVSTVEEPVHVRAHQLAFVADVVQPIAVHPRG